MAPPATIGTGREWQMIMRSPDGNDFVVATADLPVTVIPDVDDDGKVSVTVELAQCVRACADQIEQLAIGGHVPDATCTMDASDLYSPEDPQ